MAGINELALVPSAPKPLILLPSLSSLLSLQFSRTQKVSVLCVGVGLLSVGLVSHFLRRRRTSKKTLLGRQDSNRWSRRHKYTAADGDSVCSGTASPALCRGGRRLVVGGGGVERPASVASSAATFSIARGGGGGGGGTEEGIGPDTTPQQFGALGMECLGSALGLFEDALAAYTSSGGGGDAGGGGGGAALTTQEEAEFIQSLQAVIEGAYNLQDQCEHLFLHQHSVLFRGGWGRVSGGGGSPDRAASDYTAAAESRRSTLVSVSSLESFVSAQGDIADLRELDELDETANPLYMTALQLHDTQGIPYRELRSEQVHCGHDVEYLCKVHCIRLASQVVFSEQSNKKWFSDAGRQIISHLLLAAGKDPKDAVVAYDALLDYMDVCDWPTLEEELRGRGVVAITFFDVVLDFILLDAFDDLEKPPTSVVAVVQNRWLSNSFKESALSTAVWSVLKAKRRMLQQPAGFIAHFYDVTEHLSPVLAWGFLGPDERLGDLCFYFKEQIMSLIYDIFSFSSARYTTVEELAADLLTITHTRFGLITQHFALAAS